MNVSLGATYTQHSSRLIRASKSFKVEPNTEQKRQGIRVRIPRSTLPLPEIARAVLLIIGARDLGRSDKTAFEVFFAFEGTPCVFALRKFGADVNVWLPIGAPEGEAEMFAGRLLDAIKELMKIAEADIFGPAIKESVEAGELVLMNNAAALRSQYRYFRESARLGFEEKGRLQEPLPERELDSQGEVEDGADVRRLLHEGWHSWQMKDLASKEGSFNATAMVNAYFSYLEHYLSLAVAFTPLPAASLAIAKFLGDSWASKFKTVFDVSVTGEAKSLYDALLHVAETYRNPLAHGGWDKRGPTASVTLDGIGRVPLMIAGFERTVAFRLEAFDPDGFEDVCALLDKVDMLLADIGGGNAHEWIASGLDVYFRTENRTKYRAGVDEFRRYLDRNEEMWERQTNMDW
jgi:hypothetical protein